MMSVHAQQIDRANVKFNLRINAVDFLNEWTNNTMHDDAWIELGFRKNIIILFNF